MLAYGIINEDGKIGVDQDERFLLFRVKKFAKKVRLNKREKIQIFELRAPLDGRVR